MANLKEIECAPECGFRVRSHDERELMSIVKQHSQQQHNKSVTDEQLRPMMRAA